MVATVLSLSFFCESVCVCPVAIFCSVCATAPRASLLFDELESGEQGVVSYVCGVSTVCAALSTVSTGGVGPRSPTPWRSVTGLALGRRERWQVSYLRSAGAPGVPRTRRTTQSSCQMIKMANKVATATNSSMGSITALVPVSLDAGDIVHGGLPHT